MATNPSNPEIPTGKVFQLSEILMNSEGAPSQLVDARFAQALEARLERQNQFISAMKARIAELEKPLAESIIKGLESAGLLQPEV